MKGIVEALEHAQRERARMPLPQEAPASIAVSQKKRAEAVSISMPAPKSLEEKLHELHKQLWTTLGQPRSAVIAFAGIQGDEDAPKLVSAFAQLAASRGRRNVLLLSTVGTAESLLGVSLDMVQGWEEAIDAATRVDDFLIPVKGINMYVGRLTSSEAALSTVLASPRFKDILNHLRKRFDLIVLDALPLAASATAALLSAAVDGVVLVVEPRKTRWQVVKAGVDQILAQQGRVLGVVFNKQQYYIPEFIYKRL